MLCRALANPWLARHCARTGMPLSTTNTIPREDSFNLTRPPSIRQNLAEVESGCLTLKSRQSLKDRFDPRHFMGAKEIRFPEGRQNGKKRLSRSNFLSKELERMG